MNEQIILLCSIIEFSVTSTHFYEYRFAKSKHQMIMMPSRVEKKERKKIWLEDKARDLFRDSRGHLTMWIMT